MAASPPHLPRAGAGAGDAGTLARRWQMSVEQVHQWLALEPREWVLTNAKTLHAAGLSPQAGKVLHDRVDPEVRQSIGRLVDAGRMASLDTRHLHLWAAAGLLKPEVSPTRRGRPRLSFTPWVTTARHFIAAVGRDEALGALAAAAGLSPRETAVRHREGSLDRQVLVAMAGLRLASGDSAPLTSD